MSLAGLTVYETLNKMKYLETLYIIGWLLAPYLIVRTLEYPLVLTILMTTGVSILVRWLGKKYIPKPLFSFLLQENWKV